MNRGILNQREPEMLNWFNMPNHRGWEMVVVKMWWGCNKWGWPNRSFLLFRDSWQNSEPFIFASVTSCSSVSTPSLEMAASSIYGHLYHHRFTVNIPKRIAYFHSLYLLTSHHSSIWLNSPSHHAPDTVLPGGTTSSICSNCQAHRHISELLLLDATDYQFIVETTLIVGFGDAILPCFSFPLDILSHFFHIFILCPFLRLSGHQRPKEKSLFFFSVGTSFPLMASAVT